MKYSEFKKVCQSGDLIAVSHQEWESISDIESQIVRMATESEYSHVCVLVKDNDGKPCVLEAVVPEVTVSPLTKYLNSGFYHIATPDKPMSKEEEAYGMSKVGQSYSKLEAVAGYLDLLPIGGDELWQCSELTIAMRKLSGLDLGPHATPAAVVKQALLRGYELKLIERD
jgi:hypothetical protein